MDPRKAKLNELLVKTRGLAEKAETEGRDFTPEERTQVKAWFDEAAVIGAALKARKEDDDQIAGLLGLGKGIDFDAATDPLAGPQTKGRSISDLVAESIVGHAKKLSTSGGFIGDKTRVHTDPVNIGGLKALRQAHNQKAILTGGLDTGDGGAGALVQSDWRGLPDGAGPFMREVPLLSVVTTGTTGSDTVEYARVTGFTNNAAPVAEARGVEPYQAGGGQVEGKKPQSSLILEKVTAAVKTVAHWLPATKRALSDAGQLRTLIDNFLLYGLDDELEDQIINGDDTGENFEGVLEVSGTQAQAWDTDLLTTTRKSITKVRTNGKANVTAFAMNPIEDERIDLLTDDMGRYYFGGPAASNVPTLWGRPRVVSESVPAGTIIAGDWRMAVLWDREQAAIQATDSHADFFIRNLVAILAELRAAFGIIRPSAFCIIDATA